MILFCFTLFTTTMLFHCLKNNILTSLDIIDDMYHVYWIKLKQYFLPKWAY